MEPFVTSSVSAELTTQHPSLDSFIDLLKQGSDEEVYGFCCQWISEGIPYVFSKNPMLYEIVRNFLARPLKIHPKEITLIGSARIGYSLSSPPELGRVFGSHSDFDFAVISADFFNRSERECIKFAEDLRNGITKPDTAYRESLWPEIVRDMRVTSKRGFLDIWKLPYLDRYPLAKRTAATCWLMVEKLKETDECYTVEKASVRVYQDFESFIRQNRINLSRVKSKLD